MSSPGENSVAMNGNYPRPLDLCSSASKTQVDCARTWCCMSFRNRLRNVPTLGGLSKLQLEGELNLSGSC